MNVLRMRWHKGAQQQEAQHRASWTRILQSKQICMYTSFLTLPGQSRGLPVGLEELAARDQLLDDHASGSNAKSPGTRSAFRVHHLSPPTPFGPNGSSNMLTDWISMAPIARTTKGQNVSSGVCWNAR